MLNRSIDLLFKKEIIRFISILIVLFLVFVTCTIYVQSLNISEDLVRDIEKDKLQLNSDLKKLHFSFERRLNYISEQLDSISFNQSAIKKFFDSDDTLILDRSLINAIIITDLNKQVIFSDFYIFINREDNKISHDLNQLYKREYLEKVSVNPHQVVVGEIVTGILTKIPAIPIATGLRDKRGNVIGAIIFSVGLENLSKNLSRGSLVSIKIKDNIEESVDSLKEIKKNSFTFIMQKIIASNPYVELVVYNHLIKKDLVIKYDLSLYKNKILTNIAVYNSIILLIFCLIFCFYYFNILRPIKPSLQIIQKISDSNLNNFSNSSFGLFDSIVFSMTNQSQLLQQHEHVYKEQLAHIMSVICSIGSLTNYVKNKLECLTEEIQDISSQNQPHNINKKVRHIEKIIINNEREVNSVLHSFNRILKLLDSQSKGEFKITELLTECNIDKKLLNGEHNLENMEVMTINDYSVFVYKALFKVMIDEIMKFNFQSLSIKSINILEYHRLEFVFQEIGDNKILSQHEQLILCRLWGMFNDILITLEYRKDEIRIICKFSSGDCDAHRKR